MDERDVAADGLAEASSASTVEMAEAQHPGLDTSLPPASERTPEGDEIVLAQSAEEVEAQYVNRAGGPEPTQLGDANADDEENSSFSPEEVEAMADEPAPAMAPAAADRADAPEAPDADMGDVVTDEIRADDTADGGDVTGKDA